MFIKTSDLFIQPQDLNRIVFYHKNNPVTMKQFRDDVAAMATGFQSIKSDQVILYIDKDYYLFYVCFMGLLQAGKNVVLPAVLKAASTVDLAAITNILVTNEPADFAPLTCVFPHPLPAQDFTFQSMGHRTVSFFTSGSTSKPKQIIKSFQTLSDEIDNIYHTQQEAADQNPVMIASIAPNHIYGMLWRFLFGLSAGFASDTELIFSPEQVQQKQSRYPYVLFATTPSFMDKIVLYKDQYKFKQNCLKIYSSGSLLSADTSGGISDMFGVSVFEIFGCTETGGVAFRQQKNGAHWRVFDPVTVSVGQDNHLIVSSAFCYKTPYEMSDAVQMINDDSFLLLGRTDRLVKIAEERISLPQMEEKLNAHPFVFKSYIVPITTSRTTLNGVVVLSETGKQKLKSTSRREIIHTLNSYLSGWFGQTCLPKKYRFVYEIPTNEQGKILPAHMQSLFQSKMVEPVIENIVTSAHAMSADLTFIADAPYFQGHFPGYPILPGVVQIYFAVFFIFRFFGIKPIQYDIQKLKFSTLILPNQNISFSCEKKDDHTFLFSYRKNDSMCSCGIVVIKE